MADREESIHIKIKIDVDPTDKEFIENLSQDIGQKDQDIQTGKVQKTTTTTDKFTGDLEDIIKEIEDNIIAKASRAEEEGPVITKLRDEIEDLEKEVKEKARKKQKDPKAIEAELEAKKNRLLLNEFKQGPVGELNNFTTEHFANLKKAATNPGQFLLGAFTKKLGKVGGALAKGGLIGLIALLVYETVLFVIDQLMQPGRWLDRRFKRIARLETMNFYERTLQEEIRHGYAEIRVTTMPGLRGGASQVNGNFFEFSSGATGIIQSSPYRSSQEIYRSQNTAGIPTDTQGNPRRRTVSGRFG